MLASSLNCHSPEACVPAFPQRPHPGVFVEVEHGTRSRGRAEHTRGGRVVEDPIVLLAQSFPHP